MWNATESKFLMFGSIRSIVLSSSHLCDIISLGTVDICSGIYTPHSRAPSYHSWFYQAIISTLKMDTESAPETLENFHTLTRAVCPWRFYCIMSRFRRRQNNILPLKKESYTSGILFTVGRRRGKEEKEYNRILTLWM